MVQASQLFLDRFGILASIACAIHCFLVAVTPALLAVAGLDVLVSHEAEWGFTIVAIAVAAVAATTGWRKHGSGKVLLFFVLGMALLFGSRITEELGVHGLGTIIGILGGISLIAAHFYNIRTCRCC